MRRLLFLSAMLGLAAAWMLLEVSSSGDWPADSRPAVDALIDGRIGDYLSAKAMMGPFATVVQAPFAALGESGLDRFRWASAPCLLALGLLGLYLASIARRRGASVAGQAVICVICVLNPLTFEALQNGHPEELLTAALCVAAIASAAEGRRWQTGLLLGLAVASKQWAVIAILPALMALPSGRLRVGIGAAAVAALLFLPSVVASPESFLGVQSQAAGTGQRVTPWSVWYPAASTETEIYHVGGERLVAEVENAPKLVGPLSHPLIVLLALAVPLAVGLRRGLPLSGSDAFALLALLALLRCVLDPVDNLYYHAPLLLALIGWDAFSTRGLPLRGLAGVAVALLFWRAWHDLSDPAGFNAVYLSVVLALGAVLLSSLFRPIRWTAVPVTALFELRSPNFRD